ncbi:guanine nucleotide-binding protein subunit beta [Dorcoceras hygrometricum]|uniref:Guanine nucleotide-binding protein subunit beta n=1 Tax=Dorcoceras hygrometricum TaxID=472368 RepID=A0A2Z7CQ68_9LAMI|nr:guanine nucleotide-binding protein subunit beta [Dorcoceras hygrometricum]
MASSYISNALQINFDSVLSIHDNDGMVNMFRALEATGLRGFLGCSSVLYEQELEQFFDTAIIQDGDITCAVSGKYVAISPSRFAGVFLNARTLFSRSEEVVEVVEAVLVQVAEEMTEGVLQRTGDLVAVVLVERIKRELIGGCLGRIGNRSDVEIWGYSDSCFGTVQFIGSDFVIISDGIYQQNCQFIVTS